MTRREHKARVKTYDVREALSGTAYYTVQAESAAEAREKVRAGEVSMDDSRVTHSGRFRVRVAS